MKNSKKLILMSTLAALFGVAGVGTLGAAAEEVVNPGQPASFVIEHASTIRTESPFGIRFTATISADDHNDLVAYAQSHDTTVEYGMLIIPEDLLGGETLDANDAEGNLRESYKEGTSYDPVAGMTNNYEKIVVTPTLSADGKTYSMTGGIKNLNANNVSRDFAVRGYVLVDGTYYYTESFSRSIYTAATYAIDALDADSDVAKYLNRVVIDRVEAAYTQASVKITSDGRDFEYGLLHTGETFEMIGSVSNGRRTLESKATPTDMTNLQHVSRGVYKVTGFGNVSLTANVGATESVTDTALPVTTLASHERVWTLTAETDTNAEFAYKWGSKTTPFEYVAEYEGISDVLQYDSSAVKSSRWLFPKTFKPSAGDYFLFDINWSSVFQLEIGFYYNGAKSQWSASTGYTTDFYSDEDGKGTYTAPLTNPVTGVEETVTVFEWRLLNLDSSEANKSIVSNYGKWMTLEFHFPENPDYDISFENNVIAMYPLGSTADNYFANFRVQDYAAAPDVLVDFVPAEQLAEEYAQGDEIAFELVYADPIGRKSYEPATDLTVSGGAHYNDGGKIVSMLGEATVSYDVNGTPKSYLVNGPRQMVVPYTAITRGIGYDNVKDTTTTIEYKDIFMGHEDVALVKRNGYNFGVGLENIYQNAIPVGAYIYYDFICNQNIAAYTNVYGTKNQGISGNANVNVYSAAGVKQASANFNPTPAPAHAQLGKWVQVEMMPLTKAATGIQLWAFLDAGYNNSRTYVAFANVVVSLDRIVNVDEATSTISRNAMTDYTAPTLSSAEFGGTLNMTADQSTLGLWATSNIKTGFNFEPTTEEIGGVAAGAAYKSTQRTAQKQIIAPTIATMGLGKSTSAFGNDKYFYIDVYMTGEVELAVALGWNYAHTTDWLYGGTNNTYCTSITCYAQDGTVLKSYNEDGTEKKCADLSDSQFWNQWITIEIKCNGSAAPSATMNGIFINNAPAEGTELYFKDYIFTNQKRTWA